jgi:hypothetical protein
MLGPHRESFPNSRDVEKIHHTKLPLAFSPRCASFDDVNDHATYSVSELSATRATPATAYARL